MAERKIEPYQRPGDPWTCGRQEEPCPRGPSPVGACDSRAECSPKLVGQRWQCRRSSVHGGPCEEGPGPAGECGRPIIPCGPRPSLRTVRGRVVLAVTAAVVGVVTMLLASPRRNEFLAPGPLTTQHAALLRDADRCEACHAAATSGPLAWLLSVHPFGDRLGPAQSHSCLECHERSLAAETALSPHGVSPERTASLTAAKIAAGASGTSAWSATPTNHAGELACATCHREHHGADADLAAMTDAQCQSCHAEQFASFSHGHPEFSRSFVAANHGYAFNHAAHAEKHFLDKETEFDCRLCHLPSSDGEVQLVAPFEQSCGACHAEPLQAAIDPGLTLLQPPTIDLAALAALPQSPRQWPAAAQGDFDGAVSPLLKLLLAGDASASAGLARLQGDLANVDWQDAADLAAAADVAAGVQRLMRSLRDDGVASLESRLVELLGPPVEPHLEGLFSRLSQTDAALAAKLWLGPSNAEEPIPPQASRSAATTYARFQAAPPLIDPAEALLSPEQEAELARIAIQLRGELEPSAEPTTLPPAAPPADQLPAADAAPSEEPGLVESSVAPADSAEPPTRWPDDLFSDLPPPRPAGWRRDDATVRLAYHPTGHADPVLEAWLQIGLLNATRLGLPTVDDVKQSLGVASACLDCHQIERIAGRWKSIQSLGRSPLEHAAARATHFAHRPHLVQSQLTDCRHCHQMTPHSSATDAHAGFDFAPLAKATCTECHTPQAAGESCTLCHQYHWGAPGDQHPATRAASPLDVLLGAESPGAALAH